MTKKLLDGIRMPGEIRSTYLASVAGILKAGHLWSGESFMLAGMTGMAFHFIVHEQICPSSITLYDWQAEHFTMLDQIGIHSEGFNYVYNAELNTYKKQQERAIQRIKESIDHGLGVVVWAPNPTPEFGMITGYDDGDQVFFVQDYTNRAEPDPLLYINLGRSEVSVLYYQIILGKVDVPIEKIFSTSLRYGVNQWEKEYHFHPHYRMGRKGYENLILALENNLADSFGLAYLIYSYSQSKEYLAQYLDFITHNSELFKNLKDAATLFQEVAYKYKQMEMLAPFLGLQIEKISKNRDEILMLVKDSFALENQAMGIIRDLTCKSLS